jgi:restriction system protein
MHLAKRNDFRIELLQAGAFAIFVAFVYHYFGPADDASPSPEALVLVALAICIFLFITTIRSARAAARKKSQIETLDREQSRRLSEKLRETDWRQLNQIVSGVYTKLGSAATPQANAENDRQFSLVTERAGHKTAVMCKPWKQDEVTSPEIIEFSTELKRAGLSHGVFVTLRDCTAPALQVAETLGIDILDEKGLLQLLAAAGEDYRAELLSKLGDEQKHCPSCDHQMVLRTATKGVGAGEQFWGCSAYPQCHCTEPH